RPRTRGVPRARAPSPEWPSEQAPRADDQHRRHEGEDREDREAREEEDPEREHLAVDEGAEEGPPERAEAADDDHHERLDDDLGAEAGRGRAHRADQRAAETA